MKKLERVSPEQWPRGNNAARFNVWQSDEYLVQAYREKDGVVRLSVAGIGPGCRADANDIPWGDLQAIKSACGYGSYDAIEAFPPECDARGGLGNCRYLWILPKNERLPFIWRAAGHQLGMFREILKSNQEKGE